MVRKQRQMIFLGQKETLMHKRRANATTAIRAEIGYSVFSPFNAKQVNGANACKEQELIERKRIRWGETDLALENAKDDGAVHLNDQTTNN